MARQYFKCDSIPLLFNCDLIAIHEDVSAFSATSKMTSLNAVIYAFFVFLINKSGYLKCSSTPVSLLTYFGGSDLISWIDKTASVGRSPVNVLNTSTFAASLGSLVVAFLNHLTISSKLPLPIM